MCVVLYGRLEQYQLRSIIIVTGISQLRWRWRRWMRRDVPEFLKRDGDLPSIRRAGGVEVDVRLGRHCLAEFFGHEGRYQNDVFSLKVLPSTSLSSKVCWIYCSIPQPTETPVYILYSEQTEFETI